MNKRPRIVTWLALGVLTLASVYAFRFVEIIQTWDYLQTLFISVSLPYLALTALIWAVIGLGLFFGLWKGQKWASDNLKIFSILFAIYYWVDQLWLGADPNRSVDDRFQIVVTVLVLNLIFWALTRASTRKFFGELNE